MSPELRKQFGRLGDLWSCFRWQSVFVRVDGAYVLKVGFENVEVVFVLTWLNEFIDSVSLAGRNWFSLTNI